MPETSTGDSLTLASVGGLVGAGLRQKTVDDLSTAVAKGDRLIQTYRLTLEQANETIDDHEREITRLRQSDAAKDAEIARLRELVPPSEG